MAMNTSEGATVSIGPVSTASDVSDLAGLSYTVIGKVETIGEIGPQSQDVTFIPLGGDDVQHYKGSTDNGAIVVVCGRDPLDAGQQALLAASRTKFQYALKIELADAADQNDPDTVYYARGPVMSGKTNIGGANDITKISYAVGCNFFEEVPSEAVS